MELSELVITEEIQRQTIKILYDQLNTKIDSMSAGWTIEDNAYFTSIGRTNDLALPEHIEPLNFYPGTVPSLIQAPIENYPNCSAFAWNALPKGSRDDYGEAYNITLMIEFMVKSVNNELEVNSRIQKTLNAAHAVMLHNRNINGLVSPIQAPRKSMGDVFVRRAEHSRGDRWFWQGGFLEFQIDKYIPIVNQ